jgi:pimeloyl-ACP methyl ester carboxylesterase
VNTVRYSLKRVNEVNVHYHESDADSRFQIVFVSGGLNPEVWRHQVKYFSKKFRTVSYRPTVSFRDFEGEKSALENILEQDHLDNVVLISHFLGNPLAQEFEDHESVVSTVLTSPRRSVVKKPTGKMLKWIYRISSGSPKLAKKIFFSDRTEYRVVKDFLSELEDPEPADLRTFVDNYRVSRPEKKSLVVHPECDRFSDQEFGMELKPMASMSVLKNSGTFCFYEKPQEYNKALHDFLQVLHEDLKEKEILEMRQQNRSLLEYENYSRRKKEGEDPGKSEEDLRNERKKVKV